MCSVLPIKVGCIKVCSDSERRLSPGTCEALQAFLISATFDLSQVTKPALLQEVSFVTESRVVGSSGLLSVATPLPDLSDRGACRPGHVLPLLQATGQATSDTKVLKPYLLGCKSLDLGFLNGTASHLSVLHSFL